MYCNTHQNTFNKNQGTPYLDDPQASRIEQAPALARPTTYMMLEPVGLGPFQR